MTEPAGIALGISAGKPSRVTEPALTHPGKTQET
jgi:hypothetical protein